MDEDNGALYVQFDRSEAVKSLGFVLAGTQREAFVTGNIVVGSDVIIFSGTSIVDIVENTAIQTAYLTLHTVGCSSYTSWSYKRICCRRENLRL